MSWNPKDAESMKRLRDAVKRSREAISWARKGREEQIKQFVGSHYGEKTEDRTPVNLLRIGVSTYVFLLAANRPRVLAEAPASLAADAMGLQLALDHRLEVMNVGEIGRRWVGNAMFALSPMKVGRHVVARLGLPDRQDTDGVRVSRTYAGVVDLDEWVHDADARRVEEFSFAGNQVRMRVDELMESPRLARATKDRLEGQEISIYDEQGNDKIETLSVGDAYRRGLTNAFYEYWDLWLPYERKVVALPVEGEPIPLYTVKWKGPPSGPFIYLSYLAVPNQVLPIPPVDIFYDMHLLANNLMCRIDQQARDEKFVNLYRPSAAEDAEKIKGAKPEEWVSCEDLEGIKRYRQGGVDGNLLGLFLQTRKLFSWLGGNIDAMAGLAPQSPTLGQDRLLHASANQRITDMQELTLKATRKVVQAIAYYEWRDPIADPRLQYQIPGTDIMVPMLFGMEDRRGNFSDYRIDLEPYSMQGRTPSEKLQTLMWALERVLYPNLPRLERDGETLDVKKVLDEVSRLSDQDMRRFLVTQGDSGRSPMDAPFVQAPSSSGGGGSVRGEGFEDGNIEQSAERQSLKSSPDAAEIAA
jgi:hypothetical protein